MQNPPPRPRVVEGACRRRCCRTPRRGHALSFSGNGLIDCSKRGGAPAWGLGFPALPVRKAHGGAESCGPHSTLVSPSGRRGSEPDRAGVKAVPVGLLDHDPHVVCQDFREQLVKPGELVVGEEGFS